MLLYFSPLILDTLLASFHAASRAPCSCHSVSSVRPILKFWSVGVTLMRFTWANHSERRILVSNVSVTYNGLCEFHTSDWLLHVGALPENRLRRLHVLKYTTQLSCVRRSTSSRSSFQLMTGVTVDIGCHRSVVTFVTFDNRLPYAFVQIILLQHSHCTFVIIISGPFARLFINLAMRIRALFPKSTTTLGLVEQAFWRMPLFTE